MKPSPLARLCLQWPLLCLAVGACTAPPFDPQDRFAAIKPGMTREQVEKYYDAPTHWVLYYEPTGFAVFGYDKLLRYSSLENSAAKPNWPLNEGMSASEVRKMLGSPSKACAGEYYTENYAHWFCYKHDVLISKERKLPAF